jgi:methyl-accepting chemotaxis protein
LFYLHAISDGKPITDGVVILREIFFVMMAVVLALVAYRNIPIIEEYDDRTTRQRKRIEQQTEAQMEVTRDIRAMTENLGHQVDEQSVVVDSLNESMQSQAATFEEVSATLEELLGSAENIQHSASDQVEGNVTMEGIIHEFNEIKLETRDNLNATYDLIEEVVSETSVANESLTEVE